MLTAEQTMAYTQANNAYTQANSAYNNAISAYNAVNNLSDNISQYARSQTNTYSGMVLL